VPALPQLVDPAAYRACDWDLKQDAVGRAYWIDHFCRHLEILTPLIGAEYPEAGTAALEAFRQEYLGTMRAIEREPEHYKRIDILFLDQVRGELLARCGFLDPFRGIKRQENASALELLPEVLRGLDELAADSQIEALAYGLMAGNVFDLGAMPTLDRYRSRTAGFREARAEVPARPWFVDDLGAWRDRWLDGRGHRHVLFFVDNAGSDICLGCIPFARWMLSFGSRVTLVANSAPALNDVTAPELDELIGSVWRVGGVTQEAIRTGRLSVIGSGSRTPLLDLGQLVPGCVAAARHADLIILHGMGRAVESNRATPFRCDVLRTAVLKDPAVAQYVGGELFDCVFQFTPGVPA
jgi:uncharacterized protein with ATP-grasp and redox domains